MNAAATATKKRYQLLRKIRESFAEKGYRLTDQRIAILDAFLRNEELRNRVRSEHERREPKADLSREHSEQEGVGERSEHLSADDLAIKLRQEGQRVSRSTIYRTLAILGKLGLVNKLDVGDGQNRYEIARSGKHYHLICIKCGKAIDVSEKAIEAYAGKVSDLADIFSENFNFDVQNHRLEFWGICSECRRKE